MTDLPPAAQAVLDAYNSGFDRPVAVHHKPRIAAALRAAANVIAPEAMPHRRKIRAEILTLAVELEQVADNNTTETTS